MVETDSHITSKASVASISKDYKCEAAYHDVAKTLSLQPDKTGKTAFGRHNSIGILRTQLWFDKPRASENSFKRIERLDNTRWTPFRPEFIGVFRLEKLTATLTADRIKFGNTQWTQQHSTCLFMNGATLSNTSASNS